MTNPIQNNNPDKDADDLLESLIGVQDQAEQAEDPTEDTVEQTSNPHVSSGVPVQQETYQLPVAGDPWIVGRFSPGVATDPWHPQGHDGVDLKAPKGTAVFPIASGEVIDTGSGAKSGNYVKVAHENKSVESFYAHLNSINCQKGQQVNQKTVIGTVGLTGNAARTNSAHVHYQVKVNGSLINPLGITGRIVGTLGKRANLLSSIIRLADTFDYFVSGK